MFRRPNVLVVNEAPRRTSHVTQTVHEHRAPTDESVALLKEMEKEAREKIIDTIRLEGNGFECVVVSEFSAATMDTCLRAAFILNGRRMIAEHRTAYQQSAQDAMLALRDEVAKVIANEALRDIFASMQLKVAR